MGNSATINYPLVYFVILNWNQRDLTLDCLASLVQLDYPNYRIVLVDNDSQDDSVPAVGQRFPAVILIENAENLGYSKGNNVGICRALSEQAAYVFLLNNDTVVDPKMLTELVKVAESDQAIGMVGPTMYCAEPPNMIWSAINHIDWAHGRIIKPCISKIDEPMGRLLPKSPVEVDYVDTCAVLVKGEVISQVGLMNGDYFINFDDLDWNTRCREAGYKIIYVPTARMWHKVSATMGQASPATTYYMTRNGLLFFWAHAPGPLRLLAVAQIVARTTRTILAWTLKPEYRTCRRKRDANLLALRDFFLGRFGRMGSDVSRVCYGDQ